MSFGLNEYLQQIKKLLPLGALWNSLKEDKTFEGYLTAESDEYARVDARASHLINETDPRTTFELLPEWEAFAGLPDGCVENQGTIEQRQQALHAKLTAIGSQSRQYYIDYAKSLGYTITITEFPVFDFNGSVVDNLNSTDWIYSWRITAPEETIYELTVNGGVDEAFARWGNERLECAMNRLKPVHTHLIFAYGS